MCDSVPTCILLHALLSGFLEIGTAHLLVEGEHCVPIVHAHIRTGTEQALFDAVEICMPASSSLSQTSDVVRLANKRVCKLRDCMVGAVGSVTVTGSGVLFHRQLPVALRRHCLQLIYLVSTSRGFVQDYFA